MIERAIVVSQTLKRAWIEETTVLMQMMPTYIWFLKSRVVRSRFRSNRPYFQS